MKKITLCLCAAFLAQSSLFYANLFCDSKKMVIAYPVVDLRSKPNTAPDGLQGPALSKDIGDEDSQCSFCEPVLADEVEDAPGWYKVTVPNQKAWRNNQWVGYPGFIQSSKLIEVEQLPKYNIVLQNLWTPMFSDMAPKSGVVMDLPIGTMLEGNLTDDGSWWAVLIDGKIKGYLKSDNFIYEFSKETKKQLEDIDKLDADKLREKIVQTALSFVNKNISYVWGGRSPFNPKLKNQVTGVDCSGLTNLCYQANAIAIPRDAGPQRRACYELKSGNDLKNADLIFFANDEQGLKIGHVVIYIGNGQVIESTGRGFSSVHDLENKDLNKDNLTTSDLGVRQISITELIGVDLAEIESGKTIAKNGKRIFLGSYFGPDGNLNKINSMRV